MTKFLACTLSLGLCLQGFSSFASSTPKYRTYEMTQEKVVKVNFMDHSYAKVIKSNTQRSFEFCNQQNTCQPVTSLSIDLTKRTMVLDEKSQKTPISIGSLATRYLIIQDTFMWINYKQTPLLRLMGGAMGLSLWILKDLFLDPGMDIHQYRAITSTLLGSYVLDDSQGEIQMAMTGPEFFKQLKIATEVIKN